MKLVELRVDVIKPNHYLSPFDGRYRGPALSIPVSHSTTATAKQTFTVLVVCAFFVHPNLAPFNDFLTARVKQEYRAMSDQLYIGFFERNIIPVFVPSTYAGIYRTKVLESGQVYMRHE